MITSALSGRQPDVACLASCMTLGIFKYTHSCLVSSLATVIAIAMVWLPCLRRCHFVHFLWVCGPIYTEDLLPAWLLTCWTLAAVVHVGYVQLSCFSNGTVLFATFYNISMATHVTACCMCDSSHESTNNPVLVVHISNIRKAKRTRKKRDISTGCRIGYAVIYSSHFCSKYDKHKKVTTASCDSGCWKRRLVE